MSEVLVKSPDGFIAHVSNIKDVLICYSSAAVTAAGQVLWTSRRGAGWRHLGMSTDVCTNLMTMLFMQLKTTSAEGYAMCR